MPVCRKGNGMMLSEIKLTVNRKELQSSFNQNGTAEYNKKSTDQSIEIPAEKVMLDILIRLIEAKGENSYGVT